MPALTRAQRRATCFHEAGHAVVFALGGVSVYGAAVAPAGVEAWRIASSNGRSCADLWGLCRQAELVLPRHLLRWLMSEGGLHPDGRGHEAVLASPEGQSLLLALPEGQRREIRAQIVGLLAGPAAEQISRGEPPQLCGRNDLDDVNRAAALCALLPGQPPLEPAVRLVAAVLGQPALWEKVATLAADLECNGEIDGRIKAFLPAAESGWPPAWAAR
jgi:hypothetical protein